jgi:hypothetical protein
MVPDPSVPTLSNHQTVGSYVRQGRAQLEAAAAADNDIADALVAGESSPTVGAFYNIAKPGGMIDFRGNFVGQADKHFLADAGNFAYYAIGSGGLPDTVLDIIGGGYSVLSVLRGRKSFSDLVGRWLSDASANSVRDAALAAGGCPQ